MNSQSNPQSSANLQSEKKPSTSSLLAPPERPPTLRADIPDRRPSFFDESAVKKEDGTAGVEPEMGTTTPMFLMSVGQFSDLGLSMRQKGPEKTKED